MVTSTAMPNKHLLFEGQLRQSLETIVNLTDLLYGEDSEKEPASLSVFEQTILGRVHKSSHFALDLVERLECYQRVMHSKVQVDCHVDMFQLLDNAFEMVRVANSNIGHEGKSIELIFDVPAHLPLVNCDSTLIAQVIVNLLNNALKFTETGYVRLGTYVDRSQNSLVIFVEDTGIGIPVDEQTRVFDAFQRGHGHGRAGLGLGLALSKAIISRHNGRLCLSSEFGCGTIVLFELPL